MKVLLTRSVAVVTLALCLAMGACSTPHHPSPDPSTSVPASPFPTALADLWSLVWWSDPTPLPDDGITLLTGKGGVMGADCNAYQGTLTESNGSLHITDLGMTTFVLCTEPYTTYLDLLGAVNRWSRDGDSLTLSLDGTPLLRFVLAHR